MQGRISEGVVVSSFNKNTGEIDRVKIKNADYLKYHRLLSKVSSESLLDIIRLGEESEVISIFPEYKPKIDLIKNRYESLVDNINSNWELCKDIENQKDFAMKVKGLPCSGALFAFKNKKETSIREYLAKISIKTLAKEIGLF